VQLGISAYRMDVSELTAGTYVLQLSSEHESVSRKIHIQ
jgi:hypothetical protein